MKSTKEVTLKASNGKVMNYTIVPYHTSYGLSILTQVFLLMGEPLINLALAAKGAENALDVDVKPEQVNSIMLGLSAKLGPDSLDKLFQTILINTNEGTGSDCVCNDWDNRFSGEYMLLFKLVWKTLEAQYGDFLGALGGLKGLAVTRPK